MSRIILLILFMTGGAWVAAAETIYEIKEPKEPIVNAAAQPALPIVPARQTYNSKLVGGTAAPVTSIPMSPTEAAPPLVGKAIVSKPAEPNDACDEPAAKPAAPKVAKKNAVAPPAQKQAQIKTQPAAPQQPIVINIYQVVYAPPQPAYDGYQAAQDLAVEDAYYNPVFPDTGFKDHVPRLYYFRGQFWPYWANYIDRPTHSSFYRYEEGRLRSYYRQLDSNIWRKRDTAYPRP